MLHDPWVLYALLTKKQVLGVKLAFLRASELADGSRGTTSVMAMVDADEEAVSTSRSTRKHGQAVLLLALSAG